MKRKAIYFVAAFLLGLFLVIPQGAFAGTPEGTVCFQDDFGALWFLDFGSFFSGINFDVHGFRETNFTCNGSFFEPISGTATLDDGFVILGVWSVETGGCFSVAWQIPVDLFTFEGSGSFEQLNGGTGGFSLTPVDCSVFSSGKRSPQGTGLKDPAQR
jgi:hypothetical protein